MKQGKLISGKSISLNFCLYLHASIYIFRTWEDGKILIFDDSYEHEVWHNGTSVRVVFIVDVWHPDLSEEERSQLYPI